LDGILLLQLVIRELFRELGINAWPFQHCTFFTKPGLLERNTDYHRPLQGQKRIAKITEATQTDTKLYSLQSLIIPQHDSKYFAKPAEEMVEQSAPRMLAWVTR